MPGEVERRLDIIASRHGIRIDRYIAGEHPELSRLMYRN